MKRKLFFITLLMLFCTTMFGQQHWTMSNSDIVKYNLHMTVFADIKIGGETPDNISDIEIAAFHDGILRGVAKPVYKSMLGQYIAELLVYGNDYGDNITFKVFDPIEGKEYDTDYVIKFQEEDVGLSLNPVEMNFYSMHWSYINVNENYMAYPCIIKIDGVEQTNPNLELAAFINNELRGVARPKLEEAIDIYIANLMIDGENGEEIRFKLYVPELGELETDYTAIYDIDYDNGLVTIDFRNEAVAQITNTTGTHYFASLAAAVAAAQDGEIILLLKDVTLTETLTIEKNITLDLNDKNVTLSTGGNMIKSNVTIKNGNLAIADVDTQTTGNSNCFISTNVGASLTFDDINMTGDGYTTHWAVLCAMSSSTAGSTINITNSTVTLSNEKGSAGGFIKDQSGVDNYSQINISNSTLTLTNVSRGFTGAKVTLNDVDLTITGGEHGINGSELVIKNGSNVSISNGAGRAITLNKFDASIAASTVTISNMGEGGIRYKTANTLTVDANSTLSETTAHADVDNAKLNDKVVRGTESQMSTVKVEGGVTTVINPVSGQVAYRAYINDSDTREAIQVDLQNVNALSSLAVKLYDANGNLLTTTTYSAGAVERPGYLTCNIVLWGEASSSWVTIISAEKLTVDNYPHKAELVVDGNVINTFENILGNATDAAAYQLPAYLSLDCVYKAASITKNDVTTYYASLEKALKALTENATLTFLDNVTIAENWDCRSNGAKITVPVTIDGNGKTLKLTGVVNDSNWNTVFRIEKDATVKNLTIDVTEATGVQRCITTNSSIVADNCTFLGTTNTRYGIIVGEGAGNNIGNVTANINKCNFTNIQAGVSDNANGQDAKSFTITESNFNNSDVVISAAENVTFNKNVMSNNSYVDIRSYAHVGQLEVEANDNTLQPNTADNYNQIIAKLENITAQEGFLTPVAEIDGKYYVTLQDAFDKGGNVKVLTDISLAEGVTVAEGKTVVLDLNGKTISRNTEAQSSTAAITNNGNLTIKDEVGGGKVTAFAANPDTQAIPYYASNTITNCGVLTVLSGTIENSTGDEARAAYPIDNNSTLRDVALYIKGGTITGRGAIRLYANSNTNKNEVNVTAGTVTGTSYAIWVQNPGSGDPKASLNIEGGELSKILMSPNANFEGSITGGTITEVAIWEPDATNPGRNPSGFITGGTFGMDVTEFCAFNYVCTSNGDGTYGIEYKQQENNAFVIETLHELEAFRDAVNAGNTFKDQTVVLSAGVDLNPTRAINNWEPIGTQANPFKGTFDGDNKTISNLVVEGENYLGLFGKTDGATIKNVKINNVTINGVSYLGAIVGMGYTGTIDNCHVTGYVEIAGNYMVGGINGQGYATVNNSSVVANDNSFVKAIHDDNNNEGDNVGGIVGHCGETNTLTANTVKNITISGTRKVGGIVGIANQGTKVENCVVEDVTIETSATEAYANDNITTMSIGALIGQYQNNGSAGTVKDCMVKNVEFNNVNNVNVSVGPITGGSRGGTNGMLAPTGVTASGNNIFMSTITGSNNLYLMNPVAKIGETEYYTLFDAVAAVQDGETKTITMLRNTAEEFAIDNTTANITLNMAGFTLTGAITPSKANLTIENGTINNENASYSAIEINAGTLVLNYVKVTSKRHGVRIDGAVTATINGGEYTLNATSGTRHAVNVSGAANVTITGGIFVGPKGTTMDSGSAVCVQSGAEVTIEGGDFSGGKTATLGVSGTMIVKGGKFDQDPSAYLADAYTVNIENEMYVVRYTPIKVTYPVGNPVYPEGKVEYYSDMLEAVPYTTNCPRLEGATITLLADVSGAGLRFMENDMVFDLNGHTYTITDGTGSQGTNTSGFQIRPEVTTNVLFKDGTIKVAEGAPVVWMFNCYATDFIVENVTVDCSNMAYSYGGNCYVVVSREGDNVQLTGETKIVNFNSDVAGNAINVGDTMTIGEDVDLGGGTIELDGGAQLTAPANLNVVTVDDYMVVYENGVYKSVKVVAQVGNVKYESVAAAMTAAKEDGVRDLEITIIGENTQDTDDSFNLSYSTAFDNVTIKQDNDNKPFYIKSIYTGDRTSTDGKFVFDGVNMIITGQIWFECDVVLTNNSSVKRSNDVKNFIYYGEVTVEPGSKYISQIDDVMAGSFTVDGGKTDGTYNEAEDFKTVFFDVRYGQTFTAKNGANILISSGEGGKLSLMGNANIDASKVYVYNEIALGDNGKFALDIESSVTTNNVTGKGVISVDALNINEGVVYNVITANMSSFAGIIEINNDDAEYEITSTGLVVKMKPFVAEVDGTQFTSLQAAIDAADGKTVVVLDNITLTETVTVAAGTTVTLDLNGKTVSQTKEQTTGYQMILNDGNLTIVDNTNEKLGKISYTDSGNGGEYVSNTITNRGTITVKSGTIENLSSQTVAQNGYPYAIDSSIWGDASEVNTIVEGGKVHGATYSAIRLRADSNSEPVNVTVSGGEIVGTIEVQVPSSTVAGKGALVISGGKLSNSGTSNVLFFFGSGASAENIEVSVTGGEFTGNITISSSYPIGDNFNKNFITGGTFSTDVNAYCHDYYDAIQGADNLWRVEQVLFAQTTALQGGWNWFSSYVDLSTPNGLGKLQTALDGNGVQIKTQGNQFSFYQNNQWNSSAGFTSLYNEKMYMIQTTNDVNVELIGSVIDYANTVIVLNKGWNWISYPLDVNTEVNEALKNMSPSEGDIIKGYGDNTTSVYYTSDDPATPSAWWPSITLNPGQGYMYKSNTNTSFIYAAGNGTSAKVDSRDNNYWVAAKSQYANNMTIIAMLSIDNEIVKGDYEIAAFANGECRGSARPIYNEYLDAYILLLTVYGDDVEELTFKYYDIDTDTEYELSNVMNYSNDAIVGTLSDPYIFSMNILGIGENSIDNINIYPNPTTTDREINLQAICDKVEVFNALGVKVAEYHNVDTLDAFETAGIYVIRITNDNAVKHCRLVVK